MRFAVIFPLITAISYLLFFVPKTTVNVPILAIFSLLVLIVLCGHERNIGQTIPDKIRFPLVVGWVAAALGVLATLVIGAKFLALIVIIISLAVGFISFGELVIYANNKIKFALKQKREEEIKEERKTFANLLKELVGSDEIAMGFVLALEKLTEFVPGEATPLIEAVTADLEEYAMLGLHIMSSRDNDILRARAVEKRKAISAAARDVCSRLTAEALEVVREHQFALADEKIDEDEPRISVASRRLGNYLDGLREIREDVSDAGLVRKLDDLQEQIEALRPKVEVSGEVKSFPVNQQKWIGKGTY